MRAKKPFDILDVLSREDLERIAQEEPALKVSYKLDPEWSIKTRAGKRAVVLKVKCPGLKREDIFPGLVEDEHGRSVIMFGIRGEDGEIRYKFALRLDFKVTLEGGRADLVDGKLTAEFPIVSG